MDTRKEFDVKRDAFLEMVKNPEGVSDEDFSEAAGELLDASKRLGDLALIEFIERLSAFRGK